MQLLLDYGADINATADSGMTPLHRGVCHGDRGVVLFLIERGADVNKRDRCGDSVIHKAGYWNRGEALHVLLRGGKVDVEARNQFGRTGLHLAAAQGSVDAVDVLVSYGAEIDAKDGEGQTPLHVPALWGKCEAIEALLVRGANVDAVSFDGATPLEKAAMHGKGDAVNVLLAFGASAFEGRLPRHLGDIWKVLQRDCAFLDYNRGKPYKKVHFGKRRKLLYYSRMGRLRPLKRLLSKGRLVKLAPQCLEEASRWGHVRLVEYLVKEKNTAVTGRLPKLRTPLHEAARRGHHKVLRILLTASKVDRAVDFDGNTPLHDAARWGKWPCCSLLIENGSSTTIRNRKGLTPIDVARECGWKEAVDVMERRVAVFVRRQ